jgi:CubicO group peptidase (beta-lactamase class C family)
MLLGKAAREPDYRWDVHQERGLSVDDFLARQRIMGLIIVKDGVVQVERYQYDRKPSHRFVSQSMAKSVTALAIGFALAEGRIKSLDDRADQYAPKLGGTLYGATTIRNLLRMSSGAHLKSATMATTTGSASPRRFHATASKARRIVMVRDAEQGTRFHYASAETASLAAVLPARHGH